MNKYIKESVNFMDHMVSYAALAIASAAGKSLWDHVLEPKIFDIVEKNKPKKKIGFRID